MLIIILVLALITFILEARDGLYYSYVRKDAITPDSIRSNLERENYGVAACLSHTIRGGADIDEEYLDYYMLGEYADILFLKEVFEEAGNTETVKQCEDRLKEIRTGMEIYGSILDKIEHSMENALTENEEDE